MCVSVDSAEFSGTTLYAGRRSHPRLGLIQVVGYQNTAVNLAGGGNAMLLHLPTRGMSPENFIPVGPHSAVLDWMVDAVRPLTRTLSLGRAVAAGGVQVFEHDIYTVLLATDPTRIPAALDRVPARRRPRLDPDLMRFYADFYQGHTIMVCCFDNADAQRAKPLLIWYRPNDPDLLAVPALDCHTGGPPDLDALVVPDHWVLFGTDEAPEGWGSTVDYPTAIDPELRAYLPDTVIGAHFTRTPILNGDFAITHTALLDTEANGITRLQPTR